ncbi:MAG: polyamine ABC transporter substrate-binding protein, partial [Deltaproteobacteria bacterium]|nr:polyamine ABC transporter substrate-binding protein [Deltaproteobacteria bacterium]
MRSVFKTNILVGLLAVVLALSISPLASAEEGVLVIGFDAGDTLGWDPWRQAPITPDKFTCAALYSGLVRFKPGDINPANVEPDLAEKWEKSEDGLTWTFHLRKGVQWHRDYGELKAADVVYSLTMARDKSFARKDFAAFKEIKALDDYTVQVVLSEQIPSVLGVVTDYHGGWIQCKKAREELGKDYPLKPVGTGPFAFQEYIPNQRTVLVAHQKYFRGEPKIKKIVVRYMPDLSSREMAFRKGNLNVVEGPREQQWVDKMKKLPDTKIDIFGPGEIVTLHMNTSRKPFDNVKVRQAIAYAINRQEIAEFMGKDVAIPTYSPIGLDYMGGTDEVERYAYDPEKAKKLLAEAGLDKGFSFEDVITEMG